ncbi:hypothetical protein CDL15_Pgr026258 [Punica granatum]|uniref:Uncharacterized protein n=1 Tax=Punica granatum TaxID=22663 RepID=A0A218VTI2_PUNGR|nr:hypothetical protein CDL15_Pgr026258 [Punica granatum]
MKMVTESPRSVAGLAWLAAGYGRGRAEVAKDGGQQINLPFPRSRAVEGEASVEAMAAEAPGCKLPVKLHRGWACCKRSEY